MGQQTFKILAVDGGGIRGVFPAHVLSCISSRLKIDPREHFDLYAGTSTGSIIAAGLACKIAPEKIIEMYQSYGEKIFVGRKSWWPSCVRAAAHSLYESHGLREVLKGIFGDIKLGDVKVPLLLPSTDIGNGCVHVFKSNYHGGFTRDQEVFVRDAVLASCSAPIFFDPVSVGEYALADGGLWANNPSLAAVIDSMHRLGKDRGAIRVLSLGTGHAKTFYGTDLKKSWGFFKGWGGPNFISFMLSLQAQSTHNYLSLILDKSQVFRLNFESDLPLPLDDCGSVRDLISRADKIFSHESEKVRAFLEI